MKRNAALGSCLALILIPSATVWAEPADTPTPAVTGPAVAATGACGSTELSGFYGFVATGLVPSKLPSGSFHLVAIQEFGEVKYRPDGTAAAKIKVLLNGADAEKTLTGKYHIDPNTCAGILQWKEGDGDGPTWHFVVVSNGAEIETIDARGAGTTASPAGGLVFAQKRI